MSAGNFDFDTIGGRDEVDMSGIGAAIGRNKRLVIGATLGAAAAALLFCAIVKPRYMAESRILVENQESYFTRSDPDPSRSADASSLVDTEAVNSQIQLLTSRDLARKAVQILGLKGNPEFDPDASGGNPLSRLLMLVGLVANPSEQADEDRLLTRFFDHLTVMSPTKTRVLQVEFSSRDPDLAAKGANAVADLYIDLKMMAKRQEAHQAAQSLKPLIASLEARVADADDKVEQFRSSNGLFQIDGVKTTSTQQLGEITTKLAEARAAQSEAEAKAHSLRDLLRHGRLADAGDISSNDLVRRISDQRVMVRSQLASESRTLLPGHPRIKELEAQLSDIETQLRAAVDKAARGLENDARVAGARVANLNALLDEQKKAVGVSSADQAQLLELERNAKTLKDQLASEAAKYQAALARDAADSSPADARIISRAMSPSQPVFPKQVPLTIFAALAGLFFSVGGLAAREMMAGRSAGAPLAPPPPREMGLTGARAASGRPSARAPAASADAVRATARDDAPLLDRLKRAVADYGAPAVALDDEESGSAAPLVQSQEVRPPEVRAKTLDERQATAPAPAGGLVERISDAAAHGGVKVLIASAEESTPSRAGLKLARAMSRQGRAILVQIDDSDEFLGDALEQAAGSNATEEVQPGIAQLLDGEASFAEAIYRDASTRLHIVRSGGPVEMESGDLQMIFDALQATYDFVLIAGGPETAATRLPAEANLTVIFAEDRRGRDFLHDDFAAAGAREIVLAGVDPYGEIVEAAA